MQLMHLNFIGNCVDWSCQISNQKNKYLFFHIAEIKRVQNPHNILPTTQKWPKHNILALKNHHVVQK